jgi:L-cysteine:1D-myo-inositol 2-amino-2-deoxy-alpha-D-glucopyranoside ligase
MVDWQNTRSHKEHWFQHQSADFLYLYDSKANTKVKREVPAGEIPIYVCGITPYDSAHLGHAFTYSVFDVMVRFLRQSGRKVKYVQNITDVDDPLFERARRDGTSWDTIASLQVNKFVNDMNQINVLAPDEFVSVSDEMNTIIDAIEKLKDNQKVYQVDQDWYFDTENYQNFLTPNISSSELNNIFEQRGGDPTRTGKRNALDPVVFKQSQPDEPTWSSKLGTGRPGWHIECVAIIEKYLKLPLFIQGGGKDLIFPHHTMCAHQAEALTGKELATCYLHAGMVEYQGEKMSKSLGNLVFVSELIEAGFSGASIRLNLLDRNWNDDWAFDEYSLKNSQKRLESWKANLPSIYATEDVIEKIFEMMRNNFDTPAIFDLLDELKIHKPVEVPYSDSMAALISDTLGLAL